MPRSRYDQQTGDGFLVRTEEEREYLYYYFWPWVCRIGDELSLTPPHLQHTRGPFAEYARNRLYPERAMEAFPPTPRIGVRIMQSMCRGFRGYRAWEAENPGGLMDAHLPIALAKKAVHRATIIPLELP